MNALHHHAHDHEEEVILDADSGEELALEESEVSASALKDKLKLMREQLKVCQKERDENLAGWQRAKADLVNFRRVVDEERERASARARGKIVQSLIPALDAFASATNDARWGEVDATWREGVERVFGQIHKALEAEGLSTFGAIGDEFDPVFHECMSVKPAESDAADHTIAQVLQRGYKVGDEVIRAAKVVVYQCE